MVCFYRSFAASSFPLFVSIFFFPPSPFLPCSLYFSSFYLLFSPFPSPRLPPAFLVILFIFPRVSRSLSSPALFSHPSYPTSFLPASPLNFSVELYYDRGNHYEFSSVVRELDTAGTLMGNRVSDLLCRGVIV